MLKHNLRGRLLLHADDLGMTPAISDGIFRGFREGLLTSTSVLATAEDAPRALEQWKELLREQASDAMASAAARKRLDDPPKPFDLGVHLNLTCGRPLTGGRFPDELLDAQGQFPGVFSLFGRLLRKGNSFHAVIREELLRQVEVVLDHGLQPTHLNGHQYIEMLPMITGIVLELLDRFQIPVVRVACEPAIASSTLLRGQFVRWPPAMVKRAFARRFRAAVDAAGIAHPELFFGTAHAGCIDRRLVQHFLAVAGDAKAVEIAVHPGEASTDEGDPLAKGRPKELALLVSDDLVACLEAAEWRLGRLSNLDRRAVQLP